jgi:hypothetical protein
MEGKLIDGEIPKLEGSRRGIDGLFGVFVAAIVAELKLTGSAPSRTPASPCLRLETYPNVKAPLDQDKRQRALLVGEADPDFAVHQQAVVQVHDALLDALRSAVDPGVLLALPPGQAVKAKEVPVLGLHDMLLGGVPEGGTEVDKIGGIPDRGRDGCGVEG